MEKEVNLVISLFTDLRKKAKGSHFFGCVVFVIYALGFLVWNIYLAAFGTFEFNLLQTRYVSTGIMTVLILSPITLFILLLGRYIGRTRTFLFFKRKESKADDIFELGFFYVEFIYAFFITLIIFSYTAFPLLPQAIGGARPISASLIGTSEEMSYLKNFNISLMENGAGLDSVQTQPVCIFYQNEDYLLIGVAQPIEIGGEPGAIFRVLNLKESMIHGFQLKGGGVNKAKCIPYIYYGA